MGEYNFKVEYIVVFGMHTNLTKVTLFTSAMHGDCHKLAPDLLLCQPLHLPSIWFKTKTVILMSMCPHDNQTFCLSLSHGILNLVQILVITYCATLPRQPLLPSRLSCYVVLLYLSNITIGKKNGPKTTQ